MSVDNHKKEIREQMLNKRDGIKTRIKKEIDEHLCVMIYDKICEMDAKSVHLYLPINSEVNLYPLIDILLSKKITVICPKALKDRKLENRILHSIFELENGLMGTKHPLKRDIFNKDNDLIIVPGLAFDKNNFRLGYGGGYYDSFLTQQPHAHKLGVFYAFQEVERVPTEEHDVKLDEIIVGAVN